MIYTNEQLQEMSKDELKKILSDNYSNITIKGLWKMNKDEIIKEILNIQNEDQEQSKDVEELVQEIVQDAQEIVKETNDEEKDEKKFRKSKHVFKAYNQDGEIKHVTNTLKEMFDYTMSNGICNRGWVLISMNENVPVTMRIKKNETLEEYKENPRTTSKYTGNFWRFTREEV